MIEPVEAKLAEVGARIIQGDCLRILKELPDNSIDSCVTDPPAAISFMGKSWDGDRGGRTQWVAWLSEVMAEVLRVVKPGGHALVWALPRTSHWTALALEDAGWEVRDRISHIFGSGFPKSANISKHIDKMAGAERDVVGNGPNASRRPNPIRTGTTFSDDACVWGKGDPMTAPATDEAKQWEGWGSALKPATEDWWLVRKPLSEKNLASNVLKWGTGGLNIDASRVGNGGNHGGGAKMSSSGKTLNSFGEYESDGFKTSPTGRFPSNLLLSHVPGPNGCVRVGSRRVKGARKPGLQHKQLTSKGYKGGGYGQIDWKNHPKTDLEAPIYADPDGLEEVPEFICADSCPVKALDEQSRVSESKAHKDDSPSKSLNGFGPGDSDGWKGAWHKLGTSHTDKGGASRFFINFSPDPNPGFFYCPKSSKRERNLGLDGMPEKSPCEHDNRKSLNIEHRLDGSKREISKHTNHHPCVKPLSLISYLLRLVTPENGTCLDPFAGSGTTGVAALTEGFNAILIEAEPEYAEIAERRCAHALGEREEEFSGRLPF